LTDALRRHVVGTPGWWRGDPWLPVTFVALAAFLAVFVLYPLVLVAAGAGHRGLVARGGHAALAPRDAQHADDGGAVDLVVAAARLRLRVRGDQGAGGRATLFEAVPLLLLVTPPFVGGLAFLLLLGRRGLITSTLLGLDVSIYGWHGLWLAQTLSFFPVAFVILRSTLLGIDPTLEQAARDLGASRGQVLRTVTLPLATPGLLASALFIAIAVLSDFGNPMLIGGRFRVLATEVYTQLTGWAGVGTSAALGLLLLVPAVAFFALQQRVQRRTRQRFATVGGRGGQPPRAPAATPAARGAVRGLCVLVTLFVAATYLVIVLGAITQVWGVDASVTSTTCAAWRATCRRSEQPRLRAPGGRPCARCSRCSRRTWSSAAACRCEASLDLSTLLPAAIPGTLMGVAFVLAFNAPPSGSRAAERSSCWRWRSRTCRSGTGSSPRRWRSSSRRSTTPRATSARRACARSST
jgi:ABC-type spermidine/putrescine transport system permease subunit II